MIYTPSHDITIYSPNHNEEILQIKTTTSENITSIDQIAIHNKTTGIQYQDNHQHLYSAIIEEETITLLILDHTSDPFQRKIIFHLEGNQPFYICDFNIYHESNKPIKTLCFNNLNEVTHNINLSIIKAATQYIDSLTF